MSGQAAVLAQALARHAEAVCRYYLPNGRRHGRYWLVGDINNTPGRSLYVRLAGPDYGPGAAGKWADAATGEHGDLLDLIAANRSLDDFRDLCDEARHFLCHRGERLPDATAAPQPTAQGGCRLMDLKLHANATTTPRTRAYLQNSHATNAALARELGIHSRTVTALLCALREKRARSRAAQGRRRIRPGRGETRA